MCFHENACLLCKGACLRACLYSCWLTLACRLGGGVCSGILTVWGAATARKQPDTGFPAALTKSEWEAAHPGAAFTWRERLASWASPGVVRGAHVPFLGPPLVVLVVAVVVFFFACACVCMCWPAAGAVPSIAACPCLRPPTVRSVQTLSLSTSAGLLKSLGRDVYRPEGTRIVDRFFLGAPDMTSFDVAGVGPRGVKRTCKCACVHLLIACVCVAACGSPSAHRRHGCMCLCALVRVRRVQTNTALREGAAEAPAARTDALGGDLYVHASARAYLPPPLPSVRLANAGVRTELFLCAGTLLPALTQCTWRRRGAVMGMGMGMGIGVRDGCLLG